MDHHPPSRANISCQCGQIRGTLESPITAGRRVVCYCDDCQAFLTHLGPSLPITARDPNGGSDLTLTSAGKLSLTRGAVELLKATQLTPKGPVRLSAPCCSTPMFVLGGPAVFTYSAAIDRSHHPDPDEALPPISGRAYGRFAKGTAPAGTAPGWPKLGSILGLMRIMGGGWWAGEGRQNVFTDDDGKSVLSVDKVSPDELESLKEGQAMRAVGREQVSRDCQADDEGQRRQP